jgi:hypothetical protein
LIAPPPALITHAFALTRIDMPSQRNLILVLVLVVEGLAGASPGHAADRFQLFVTGVTVDPGTQAYVFTALKTDNVEAAAWDCTSRIPTRRGDGVRASCRRANYQWRLTGNAEVRSYSTYPFVEALKGYAPMPAMWQLNSGDGGLQICVNNPYNATASGCFLFIEE